MVLLYDLGLAVTILDTNVLPRLYDIIFISITALLI